MEREELLRVMDAAASNLAKAESVWERARPLLPEGPPILNDPGPEYTSLAYAWRNLIAGLPPIQGWTITMPLPDPGDLIRDFIDFGETGELPWPVWEARDKPGKDLAEYKHRLGQARREAVHSRLEELAVAIDTLLAGIVDGVARDSRERIETVDTEQVQQHLAEAERLLGDAERTGRWGDLYRHVRFGEGHDWWDIVELDWPSIKPAILSAVVGESDPVPIPEGIDLGVAAAAAVSGGVTTAMQWANIVDDQFERLLFDLVGGLSGYENVEWLMATRAPDRGRDLSCYRSLQDGSGRVRRERVIIQAKHWQSKSVGPAEILDARSRLSGWAPHVHALIVATSGRFTADAVSQAEHHNETGMDPFIELWPNSELERLLAQRPELVTEYYLRG